MRKIMFNDNYGLTQAVIEHRKTMTRRLVGNRMTEDDIRAYLKGYTELADKCAQYKIGDVVAVAQSYKSVFEESLSYALPRYHWLDDHIDDKGFGNKMFVKASEMPHQIRITDIKVERLQDISEDDCLKEGLIKGLLTYGYGLPGGMEVYSTPREAFASLIDKVSGKGTWESNPYVFAYAFKLLK